MRIVLQDARGWIHLIVINMMEVYRLQENEENRLKTVEDATGVGVFLN